MFAATRNGNPALGGVVLLLFFVVGAALYFVPTIVALARKVPNVGSVIVVNLFLGWSFIGWIVALALACRSKAPAPTMYLPGQGFPMQPGTALPTAPGVPPPVAPAGGWHPDPHGAARLRYHDGNAWTAHTHD